MSTATLLTSGIVLGSIRTLIVSGMFFSAYFYGPKIGQDADKGRCWLLGGFALLFFSSVLNVINTFHFIANISNLTGIICLFIGFRSWLPLVAKTSESQTQAKLLETQQRYRDLADLSPDGILLHRMGKIIYANSAVAKMVGVASPDDLIGRTNTDFIHPAYKAQTNARMRALGGELRKVPLIHLKLLNTLGATLDVEVAAGITNFGGRKVIHSVVRDVSERMKAEETLKQSESDLRSIFNNMAEFYYRTDLQGHIVRASGAAKDILGYGSEDIIGHKLADYYVDPCTHEKFLMALHDADNCIRNYEAQWITNNREHIWVSTNAQYCLDLNGSIVGVEGTVRNITDTVQARDVLKHMALHDVLTGLDNRRSFEVRLKEALARARRTKRGGAILYFDLDNFKPVNDTYGHDLGDNVLREVGQRLMKLTRETDFAARIGGDEFCLILEGTDGDDAAARVAQKLISSLSRPYTIGDDTITIGTSVGIAAFDDSAHEVNIHDLTSAADRAMYQAKLAGGNTLRFARTPSKD